MDRQSGRASGSRNHLPRPCYHETNTAQQFENSDKPNETLMASPAYRSLMALSPGSRATVASPGGYPLGVLLFATGLSICLSGD